MSRNIVFLVHGIGQHPPGWSREPDGPIVALDHAWKLYQNLNPEAPLSPNIEDHLEFVEICYDDIFDTVIDTWADLGKSIPASTNFPWVNEVTQLMNSVGTKNGELFLRFAGDVLLYCGFKLVARTIRLRVNAVIASKLYDAHLQAHATVGSVPRCCVIAHSLGSTVAQDALYELATADWFNEPEALAAQAPQLIPSLHPDPGIQASFQTVVDGAKANPGNPVPVDLDSIFLVSNTIPLLQQAAGEFAQVKNGFGDYECGAIFNVNNRYDPVSRVCKGWNIADPDPETNWLNVRVQHLHEANVHSFGHYLSNPAVHGLIFERLVGSEFTKEYVHHSQALASQPEWLGIGGDLATLEAQTQQALLKRLQDLVKQDPMFQTFNENISALGAATKDLLNIIGKA